MVIERSAAAGDPGLGHLGIVTFVQPNGLRAQVAETLRALLITGRMRPGVSYSAPKLAAEFGVSATPVREAMQDLVNEGLVEVMRNKGFRVTSLSDADLDELAEIRLMVEVPAMGLVAQRCSDEVATAVERLRPVARAIEAAAESGDLLRFIEGDTDFHLSFLALAGNRRLVEVVRDLRSRSRLYGLQRLSDAGQLGHLGAEHEQMVDLALAQDADGLRALVSTHIGHVRSVWAGDAGGTPSEVSEHREESDD